MSESIFGNIRGDNWFGPMVSLVILDFPFGSINSCVCPYICNYLGCFHLHHVCLIMVFIPFQNVLVSSTAIDNFSNNISNDV